MVPGASLLLWQCGRSIRHTLSLCFGTMRALGEEHQPPEGDNNPCGPIMRGKDKMPPSLPQQALWPAAPPHPLLLFLPLGRFGGNPEKLPGFIMQPWTCILILQRSQKDDISLFLPNWGYRKMMVPLMQACNPSGQVTQVSVCKETWRSNPPCLSVLFALVKVQSVTSPSMAIESFDPLPQSLSWSFVHPSASVFHPSSPPYSFSPWPMNPWIP